MDTADEQEAKSSGVLQTKKESDYQYEWQRAFERKSTARGILTLLYKITTWYASLAISLWLWTLIRNTDAAIRFPCT